MPLSFLHQETGSLLLPPQPNNMSEPKNEGKDNRPIKQILRDYEEDQRKRNKIAAGSEEIRNEGTIVAKKKAIVLRELQQTVECASKLSALLYSIFLLPANAGLMQELRRHGKQHAQRIKLHMHSLGATPIFAFGTLLLLAADTINSDPGTKNNGQNFGSEQQGRAESAMPDSKTPQHQHTQISPYLHDRTGGDAITTTGISRDQDDGKLSMDNCIIAL